MAVWAVVAAPASASWRPAAVVAPEGYPTAAAALGRSAVSLWTDRAVFSWPDGAIAPLAGTLPALAIRSYDRWEVNSRGDAVLVAGRGRIMSARAIDASGVRTSALERVGDPDFSVHRTRAAIGEDGTSTVAWTASDDGLGAPELRVRIRTPGSEFLPAIVVRAPDETFVDNLGVAIDGAGVVHVAFSAGTAIWHIQRRPGEAVFSPPQRLTDEPFELYEFELRAGRSGSVYLMYQAGLGGRIVSLTRSFASGWSPPHVLAPEGWASEGLLAVTPDGGALVTYEDENDVQVVRRAPPDGAFGAPVVVGQPTPGWSAYTSAVTGNAAGEVLVAWVESSGEDERFGLFCGNDCHERVMAAVAEPGRPFGAPQPVSPAGALIEERIVVALSETGERLVAWQAREYSPGTSPAGALMAARGDRASDGPPTTDRRAPRAKLSVTQRQLRAASRGRRLRLGLDCDERCAARVVLLAAGDDEQRDLSSLPARLLEPSRTRVAWTLDRRQRRTLARLLRFQAVYVLASVVDDAGNIRIVRRRVPLER